MALHEKFSDDVVVNILAWLPPKEVARMRVVCKKWHALTSEHHFLYTSFLRNSSHSTAAGFFLTDELHRRISYIPLRHGMTDGHPTPDLSFIPSTPAIDRGQIYITSSCNGLLICCRPNFLVQYKPRCYLCNPVTKSFIDIDVPDGISRHLSLAYDPSKSQNYRIVALGATGRDIHMYSSQTRSWRIAARYDRSNYAFAGLRFPCSVFWNGSLVWMVSQHLIRFVMDEEQVVEMPMPRTPEGWKCSYLGESGGHLQMIGFTQEERLTGFLDVLEMQEGCSEWSVLYRVDLRRIKELHPDIRRTSWEFQMRGLRVPGDRGRLIEYLALLPVYVVRGTGKSGQNGVLLFSIPGKVMSYDTEDQTISTVHEDVSPPRPSTFQYVWYHCTPCSPSLFAL